MGGGFPITPEFCNAVIIVIISCIILFFYLKNIEKKIEFTNNGTKIILSLISLGIGYILLVFIIEDYIRIYLYNEDKITPSIGMLLWVFIDLGLYIIFLNYLNHFYAKLYSFIIATCFTYIMNKLFTFKLKNLNIIETLKFVLLYCISSYINAFLNERVFYLSNNVKIAFIVATVVCLFINFFGLRFFVFIKKED